jgi:hypothetical protein
MISSILPKTKMNFVKSSNFYGSLKLVKRHFLWTTSVATRSLKRVNFVTSSEVLVKTTCTFTVDHIHILRSFALVKKMVNSCVAANCTNKACFSGISVHTIPYYDDRPDAKGRRKIWVDFVKAKRVFEPSKAWTLCSILLCLKNFISVVCFSLRIGSKRWLQLFTSWNAVKWPC